MTGLACMVAALAYNPGYLLVVAFDVVLAGCFVPLMAAIYWPSMTPNAGRHRVWTRRARGLERGGEALMAAALWPKA